MKISINDNYFSVGDFTTELDLTVASGAKAGTTIRAPVGALSSVLSNPASLPVVNELNSVTSEDGRALIMYASCVGSESFFSKLVCPT